MTRLVIASRHKEAAEVGGSVRKMLSKLLMGHCLSRPRFSSCWINPLVPKGCELIDEYSIGDAKVSILSVPGGVRAFYHLSPWEYSLPLPIIGAIRATIDRLSEIPPANISASYGGLREHVYQTCPGILSEEMRRRGLPVGSSNATTEDRLVEVVARYTVGLGVFEILLSDDKIEDIYVDAPSDENPVHLTVNGVAGFNTVFRCSTNITASREEIVGLTSRLRQYSKLPFSEAFPTMETDVQGFDARATVMGAPLSPMGTAVALRRHSATPWTLLKLAYNGTISALAAGLLSFLVDGRSTILICGPRGAGKSALLSALLFEFPISQRILTIEDTAELPIRQMQRLGYKVQSMLVEPGLGEGREEKTDEALRVSLRLGESAIVLGEVRGKEAQTLYQSMRTGKAGSSVIGTIHGDTARSVYERVVHDMGIPKEAFGATDIVLSMSLNRPKGTHRQVRRLVEVVECSNEGPGEFSPLMSFDFSRGRLSDSLLGHSKVIGRIATAWNMKYDEALSNIRARAEMRAALVDAATNGNETFLGPEWVCRANEFLWQRLDAGITDYRQVSTDFRAMLARGRV